MRRVLFVMISVLLLISTALAYMASTWTVANSMTVVAVDVNIKAYEDQAYTKPLTSLSWGEIKQGDKAEKIFWIKNVGKDNGTAAWYSDLEYETADEVCITGTKHSENGFIGGNHGSYILHCQRRFQLHKM